MCWCPGRQRTLTWSTPPCAGRPGPGLCVRPQPLPAGGGQLRRADGGHRRVPEEPGPPPHRPAEMGVHLRPAGGGLLPLPPVVGARCQGLLPAGPEVRPGAGPRGQLRLPGHVRISYCVPTEQIQRARPSSGSWRRSTGRGEPRFPRSLRQTMTPEERHLWYDFLRQLPVTVRRQKPLGRYVVVLHRLGPSRD